MGIQKHMTLKRTKLLKHPNILLGMLQLLEHTINSFVLKLKFKYEHDIQNSIIKSIIQN